MSARYGSLLRCLRCLAEESLRVQKPALKRSPVELIKVFSGLTFDDVLIGLPCLMVLAKAGAVVVTVAVSCEL